MDTLEKQIKFWEKADLSGNCWNWQASKNENGYGYVRAYGKTCYAHRIAYTLIYGPIPEGFVVCHKCDNPSCVNPGHFFLGTSKENTEDMMTKGRYGRHKVLNTHCKQGHEFTEENTYMAKPNVRQCRICMRNSAKKYYEKKTSTTL